MKRDGDPTKGQVAFIHPDLGLGGAERLIVDAAVALQRGGYDVTIFTAYHNPDHAFPETTDGTIKVVPVCQWIPRTIGGRFIAAMAYIKMTLIALYLSFLAVCSSYKPKVVIIDQVSACIPALKLMPCFFRPKIMFYCHFPDLLQTSRGSFVKELYRAPLDFLEQFTTGLSDRVVVNSLFTRSVFQDTFKRLTVVPDVLYPSINTKLFDDALETKSSADSKELEVFKTHRYTFLSVNRFEGKKNIGLAIKSLKKLRTCLDEEEWKQVHLICAGGFDPRLEESVKYLEDLKKMCSVEGMNDHVTFLLSPKDDIKVQLLSKCLALLYTPSNEHFGIVPLEAMYMGKAVIAVDSGGPRETVVNETTGFLCPANEDHFGAAMARLVKDSKLVAQLGKNGKERFKNNFSFEAFSRTWDQYVKALIEDDSEEDVHEHKE